MSCGCDNKLAKRMRNRVTLRKPTVTISSGEQSTTYSNFASRRCHARPMRTGEVIQAEQVWGEIGWIIELRADSKTRQIKDDWQLVLNTHDNKTLNLEGAPMPVDGGREWLRIRAMEKVT